MILSANTQMYCHSALFANVQIPMILQEGSFMIISELKVHTLFKVQILFSLQMSIQAFKDVCTSVSSYAKNFFSKRLTT